MVAPTPGWNFGQPRRASAAHLARRAAWKVARDRQCRRRVVVPWLYGTRQSSSTWSPLTPPTRTGDRLRLRREDPRSGPDRAQPSPPMKPGRTGTMTRGYKRHDRTDLIAAMNLTTGEVLYGTRRSHKTTNVLAFFKRIDVYVPRHLEVDVVLDNLSVHKAEPIAPWFAHRRRTWWQLHFTPTFLGWLNLVEGRFSLVTERRLTHGLSSSVDHLVIAIETWPEHWNDEPKSFVWMKPANDIVSSAKWGRLASAAVTSAKQD